MAGISDEVRRLAEDLAAADIRLDGLVDRVVEKGALNIKNDWRSSVAGSRAFSHLQFAVGYDRVRDNGSVGAVIGYDKDRVQGPLGNIREFGTSREAGHLDGQRALDAEESRFIAALEDAIETAVLP